MIDLNTKMMESLPDELLDLILTYCDHASLKALRLVKHHLSSLATPFVFSHFYLAPCIFDDSLAKLDALIRSPRKLASHIKHLTFLADILPPWDRHKFEARAARNLSQDGSNDKSLAAAWKAFDALRTRQTDWFYDNTTALHLFAELVSSLPNLTSASSGIAVPFHGSTARWPVWSRLKAHMLISPDDWIFDHDSDYLGNDNRMLQSARATLNMLEAIGFRASFAGTTQVQSLRVHCMNNGRWKALLAGYTADDLSLSFSPQLESRFQTLSATFAHLAVLDLDIPHPVRETSRDLSYAEQDELLSLAGREVASLLSHARGLRSLRLAYDSESVTLWEPGEESLHPLFPLLGGATIPWPKIERLNLSVNMPHTLLLSFLALLAPTLRGLELRDMCVYDAQVLFAELPNVLKLESIYVECLWTKINIRYANAHLPPTACIICEGLDADEPYERGLKAYLLGKADVFPRLPGREFMDGGDEAVEVVI